MKQLQNLTVVCEKCAKIGQLEQLASHTCPPIQAPREQLKSTIVETVPPSNKEQEILKAAHLLREEALKHKKGDPIPYEIEQATDRWTWMKLQQGHKVASLRTGGRVSQLLFHNILQILFSSNFQTILNNRFKKLLNDKYWKTEYITT